MPYKSMKEVVADLVHHKRLIRIDTEVDPDLVLAEIHRRVFDAQGPALLFENVKGTPFPVLTNLFGTFDRTEFLFRDTLDAVRKAMLVGIDPFPALKKPLSSAKLAPVVLNALPRKVSGINGRFLRTTISSLPQIKSWPLDGGAFITMPQVLTLPPDDRNIMHSNLGMYRVQLSGNEYVADEEIGLHYQIHRGIGVHHQMYNTAQVPFRASIFVGGNPSHSFSAIMPMPEGLSELTVAGMLAGRRFRYAWDNGYVISTDADFVITGTIARGVTKPEGPFGDHLGYYSLTHPFPVMRVENVYHRPDAIWHATVVGRPPQEDSSFGHLIHELVGPVTSKAFPGVEEVHAVDASGVHPLLLAIGQERYMPFRDRKPEEILTIANHLLGKGQTSLAKYLWIAASGDAPGLSTHDLPGFFRHMLERIDFQRDLHFYTSTTIDTLDYSGQGWNAGSKLVIAACGNVRRKLSSEWPSEITLPEGFRNPQIVMPGIAAIQAPAFTDYETEKTRIQSFTEKLNNNQSDGIPLIILCDDSGFTARTVNNFVWVTFTRSNPATDTYGVASKMEFKHWGCKTPFVIDARIKPHHAPVLVTDPLAAEKANSIIQSNPELKAIGI